MNQILKRINMILGKTNELFNIYEELKQNFIDISFDDERV